MQACSLISAKRFKPGQRSDVADFMAWLLNILDRDLCGFPHSQPHSPPRSAACKLLADV